MSNYDFNEQPAGKTGGSRPSPWDLLSIAVLLITVCIIGYFALIFINPNMPLNPFPPLPTPFQFPHRDHHANSTSANLDCNQSFAYDRDGYASLDLYTDSYPDFLLPRPADENVHAHRNSKAPFYATVQPISSTIIYPDLGCNFFGIGGTITDASGADIFFQQIVLAGSLNGQNVPPSTLTVSGVVPAYGRSGFEFNLGTLLHLTTVPVASTGTLYLYVQDQSGLPLSDNVYINTYNDCSKNLVIVHFKKRQ